MDGEKRPILARCTKCSRHDTCKSHRHTEKVLEDEIVTVCCSALFEIALSASCVHLHLFHPFSFFEVDGSIWIVSGSRHQGLSEVTHRMAERLELEHDFLAAWIMLQCFMTSRFFEGATTPHTSLSEYLQTLRCLSWCFLCFANIQYVIYWYILYMCIYVYIPVTS